MRTDCCEQGRPSLWPLAAVVAVPLGSLALAVALYLGGWGATLETRAEGRLLPAGLSVSLLGITPDRLQGHWALLVLAPECAELCRTRLEQSAQVQRALGRELPRLRRWLLTAAPTDYPQAQDLPPLSEGYLAEIPVPLQALVAASEPLILLADPLGNLVLAYGWEDGGRALLKDLKRLLRASHIG